MSSIAVLGAGSWGTALAGLIARNGYQVNLWGSKRTVQDIRQHRRNLSYLPDLILPPERISVYDDLASTVENVQDVLIVVPSFAFRSIIEALKALRPTGICLAWGTKGLDSQRNQLLHEVIEEIYQQTLPMAVIAGPSFANEVAVDLPTAVTLTSNDSPFSQRLSKRLHGQHFRIYTQSDLIGVQICGAVKNGLAVAAGISDGLGYGSNARSALITRGLSEMASLGVAMGADPATFMGLAGVGDLVLTCTDDKSRNRRFGYAIGRGVSVSEAEKSIGQVVEGKANVFRVMALANKYQVEMPITEQVCQLLEGKVTPLQSVDKLFSRAPKAETPFPG